MTDSSNHIFPTTHRSRHSKFLSYPVGAELLSRALDGVPQHGAISCDFTAGNMNATAVAGRIGEAALTITYDTIAKRLLTAIRDGIQPERR
jgi:hypothetical protein